MTTNIIRLAAFSDGLQGGNPSGIWIGDALPDVATMQKIAAEVGFSETVFAAATGNGWYVRYFSPESEVAFCGHATIALGAVLASQRGDGVFSLTLHMTGETITVEGQKQGTLIAAALQSPKTSSRAVDASVLAAVLNLFGYVPADLDPRIPPAIAHGGATHLVLALNSRQRLREMRYDLAAGRRLMNDAGLVTILLAYAETPRLFHTRNPFASGGVYEDPATGAATAALAGYLRDIDWPHEGAIEIIQGEDMGSRSRLRADILPTRGTSIRVSGTVRPLV